MTSRRESLTTWGVVAAIALLVMWVFVVPRLTEDPTVGSGAGSGAAISTGDTGELRELSGTISVAELPPEAIDTLELIDSDGPFPYRKDGSVFQNREGLLPDEPMGYYREYTVDTPGSDDRGARRIVGGDGGDLWYTADHYASFALIDDW